MPVPRRFDRRPPERDQTRINERIRVPEVRVIGDDGNQVGIMRTEDALRMAQERDLDLVEVAPEARPPVTRILDYSKYKYEQAQKQKAARKHQQRIVVREIKFRPKIAEHDYATKKGHVERFLRHKDKVKITIMFRGRETTHPERGSMILERLADELQDIATIEQRPNLEGRNMTMLLGPSKAVLSGEIDNPEGEADADASPDDGQAVVEAPVAWAQSEEADASAEAADASTQAADAKPEPEAVQAEAPDVEPEPVVEAEPDAEPEAPAPVADAQAAEVPNTAANPSR